MRRLAGESLVQVAAVRGQPADAHAQNRDDDEQHGGQMPIDGAEMTMLPTTAAPGGMVVQVSEFSMVQAAFAAAVMRPASAPGRRSTK